MADYDWGAGSGDEQQGVPNPTVHHDPNELTARLMQQDPTFLSDQWKAAGGEPVSDTPPSGTAGDIPDAPKPSWGQRVRSWFRGSPGEYLDSAARGAAKAVPEMLDTVKDMLASGKDPISTTVRTASNAAILLTGHDPQAVWNQRMSDQAAPFIAKAFGGDKRDGALGATEDVAQFATAMWAAGELPVVGKLGEAGSALQKMAGGAVRGGIAQGIGFDPRAERMSNLAVNMAQNGPSWLANPVTQFLASKPGDSDALGRLKNTLEGTVVGSVMEATLGGLQAARAKLWLARRGSGEMKAAAESELQQGLDQHAAAMQGTAPHADPVDVKPTEQGTFQLVNTKTGEAGPVFDSPAEAHAQAASVNIEEKNSALPQDGLSDEQVAQARQWKEAYDSAKPKVRAKLLDQSAINLDTRYDMSGEQTKAWVGAMTGVGDDAHEGLASALSPKSWKETFNEAERYAQGAAPGIESDHFVNMIANVFGNTEKLPSQVLAFRMMLRRQAQHVGTLSRVVDMAGEGATEAMGQLRTAMTSLYDQYGYLTGISSNVGRALNIHKVPVDEAGALLDKGTLDAVAHGRGSAFTEMSDPELVSLARAMRAGGEDPGAVMQRVVAEHMAQAKNAAMNAAQPDAPWWTKAGNSIANYRVGALISGPKSFETHAAGNIINLLAQPAAMWWSGVKHLDGSLFQQGTDFAASALASLHDSAKYAKLAWQTGDTVLDNTRLGRPDYAPRVAPFGSATWGQNLLQMPSRAWLSAGEFFTRLNYMAQVRSSLLGDLRQTLPQGISPEDGAKLMQDRLSDSMSFSITGDGRATLPASLEFAKKQTFQQTPAAGTLSRTLYDAQQAHWPLKIIFPVLRTPMNILNQAVEYTPGLNRILKGVRDDLAAGGTRAAVAQAKTDFGMMVWGSAAAGVLSGHVTGGGPSDPVLRRKWMDAGNQPYSIRTPDGTQFSYRRFEPLSLPLAVTADALTPAMETVGKASRAAYEQEAQQGNLPDQNEHPFAHTLAHVADTIAMSGHMADADWGQALGTFLASTVGNLMNKNYMEGAVQFMDSLASHDPNKWSNFSTTLAASFVPNALRQLDPTNDTRRESHTFMEKLKSRIPGMSQTLEPERNLFGEKVMLPPGYENRAANLATMMDPPKDKDAVDALLALGKSGLSAPPPKLGDLNLRDRGTFARHPGDTQSPWDRMNELVASPEDGSPSLRQQLVDFVQSDRFKELGNGTAQFPSDSPRLLHAQAISTKAWGRAMQQVVREYPKLKDELRKQGYSQATAFAMPPIPGQ